MIREQLRTTLLSLKQISDRLKNVITKTNTIDSKVDTLQDSVDNIDFDKSDLAKVGSNVNATNTAILDATLDNGALLDQSIAAQLYAIIGEEEDESESES